MHGLIGGMTILAAASLGLLATARCARLAGPAGEDYERIATGLALGLAAAAALVPLVSA